MLVQNAADILEQASLGELQQGLLDDLLHIAGVGDEISLLAPRSTQEQAREAIRRIVSADGTSPTASLVERQRAALASDESGGFSLAVELVH
jgi:hypothetical protein